MSLDAFAGQVIRPGDSEYDAARVVWNGMVDRRPALVVRPTGPDDVLTALRHARQRDLVVAVRCGGHSIPGHSTCDGGMVIDLSHMRGAAVDPERRTAVCAGGALLAELDEAAFNRAVDEVTHVSMHLLADLVTNAPPKDREVEAARRRARAEKRFATA